MILPCLLIRHDAKRALKTTQGRLTIASKGTNYCETVQAGANLVSMLTSVHISARQHTDKDNTVVSFHSVDSVSSFFECFKVMLQIGPLNISRGKTLFYQKHII